MMRTSRELRLLLVALLLPLPPLTSACSLAPTPEVTFKSSRGSSQVAGLEDRQWGESHRIGPYANIQSDAGGFESQGFDLKIIDGEIWLAASFYSTQLGGGSGSFFGYLRRYRDATGWDGSGDGFGAYISLGASNVGHVGLSSLGRVTGMSAESPAYPTGWFFTEDGNGLTVSRKTSSGWQTARSTASTCASSFPVFEQGGGSLGTPDRIVIEDPYRRTWAFFQPAPFSGSLQSTYWTQDAGLAGCPTDFAAPGGTNEIHGVFSGAFDGRKRICLAYVENTATWTDALVRYRCLTNIDQGGTAVETEVTLGTNEGATSSAGFEGLSLPAAGVSLAYGGSRGELVAAFLATSVSGGPLQLKTRRIKDGVLSGAAVSHQTGMPSGFEPANLVAPAIAHLGDGRMLLVWSAYHVDDEVSALFSSLYTPADGWSAPEMIDSIEDSDGPAYFKPELFSDEAEDTGHAGLAVRYYTETALSPASAPTQVKVGRYHPSRGWMALEQVGAPCVADSRYGGCFMPPKGAVLPSGRATVIFQDRDSNDIYRLSSVEFE